MTTDELNKQTYRVEKVKQFLEETKNVKGVEVERYFADKEMFRDSVNGRKKEIYLSWCKNRIEKNQAKGSLCAVGLSPLEYLHELLC